MPSMIEVKCISCKKPFMARTADRKRGWGKFCSKSCKAVKQEQKTGQMSDYIKRKSICGRSSADDIRISNHDSNIQIDEYEWNDWDYK